MRRALSALVLCGGLAACAAKSPAVSVNPACSWAPSQTTFALLQVGITEATVAGQRYEAEPGTSAARISGTRQAVAALQTAWTDYQAAVKTCAAPNVAALQAALDQLNAIILPAPAPGS